MAAVRWLHRHMRDKDNRKYTVSDVIRMAIAQMYENEGGPAHPDTEPSVKLATAP